MKKDYVGVELRVLSNLIMRQVENDTKQMNLDDLTATNGWILEYLLDEQEKEIYQKDLENAFGTTRSTISKVLMLMEQKGYITRESVVKDARLKRISLTPKAVEVCKIMRGRMSVMEDKLMNGFRADEKKLLLTYINRMKENMS